MNITGPHIDGQNVKILPTTVAPECRAMLVTTGEWDLHVGPRKAPERRSGVIMFSDDEKYVFGKHRGSFESE